MSFDHNEFKELLFDEIARRCGSPFAVRVYGYDGKPRETKGFETQEQVLEFIENKMAYDLYADSLEVAQNGVCCERIDLWDHRTKVLLDGWMLPVHEQFEKEHPDEYLTQWIEKQKQ